MNHEDLLQHLDVLITEGQRVTIWSTQDGDPAYVDMTEGSRWIARCLNSIRLYVGEDSEYYSLFRSGADELLGSPLHASHETAKNKCLGAMMALRDDASAGHIVDPFELAAADVFDDLLAAAKHLFDKGHHLPAAAIAGAVLEDGLRRLCEMNDVEWEGDSSISKLSQGLRKESVIRKSEWRQIDTWGDIRNDVDHGKFENPQDVPPEDVKRMLQGIADFLLRHLPEPTDSEEE